MTIEDNIRDAIERFRDTLSENSPELKLEQRIAFESALFQTLLVFVKAEAVRHREDLMKMLHDTSTSATPSSEDKV